MILFEGNLPQKQQRERERAQASWMPNDMETAGNRAPQVEFPSLFLPVLWMCTTVFAWFTPSLMDCRVWSQVLPFRFTFTVFCAHLWQKTPAILKWSSKNLTVIQIYMYIYIYIHNIYIHIYVYLYYVCGQNYKGSLTCGRFRLVHSDTRATEALSLKALWRRL